MNIKGSNKTVMPQEMKAKLYMQMGIMIEVVVFLWSIKKIIPNVAFVVVAIVGLIPAVKMARTEFSEQTDEDHMFWNKAELNAGRLILQLVLFYWAFICIDQMVDLPVSANPIFIIPGWIGIGLLFTGNYFRLYKRWSKEDEA